MDKFASLQAFTQVVRSGGFAAAARHLGLSRSSVNKLVLHLEQELQVQLLHRTTRQVHPTATGLAFYQNCVDILAALEEAEQAVTQLQTEPRGTLRVNAPMTFGTFHLAPVLLDFMAQYPAVQVQLTLNDRFIDPIEEGFDLTIRIAEPPEAAGLVVELLAPAPRVLCASPHYLAVHGIPTHPQDLKNHSCLHYGYLATGQIWKLRRAEEEHTISVQGSLCCNNGEVLQRAALCGLGVALLPLFMVESDLHQGKLERVLADYTPPEIFICLLYPTHRHLSTKVRLLTEFLQQHWQKDEQQT